MSLAHSPPHSFDVLRASSLIPFFNFTRVRCTRQRKDILAAVKVISDHLRGIDLDAMEEEEEEEEDPTLPMGRPRLRQCLGGLLGATAEAAETLSMKAVLAKVQEEFALDAEALVRAVVVVGGRGREKVSLSLLCFACLRASCMCLMGSCDLITPYTTTDRLKTGDRQADDQGHGHRDGQAAAGGGGSGTRIHAALACLCFDGDT